MLLFLKMNKKGTPQLFSRPIAHIEKMLILTNMASVLGTYAQLASSTFEMQFEFSRKYS